MSKRNKVALYMHGGSGNHGCEAIINSLCRMTDIPFLLLTNSEKEEYEYTTGALCEVAQEKKMSEHFFAHVLYYGWRKLTGDDESFLRYRYRAAVGKHAVPLALSVGGDTYCYEMMVNDLLVANRMFNRQGTKTVLVGCSIEPELLKRPEILEDMNRYHKIFARESITYQALLEAGVAKEKVLCIPDPAFTLQTAKTRLPEGFEPGNTVGINVSPLIQSNESGANKGIVMENYRRLIRHILGETKMKAALIPHVVWERNDDRPVLVQLFEEFKHSGRVLMVEDASCEVLKAYISECRFFVGARTHATIAAYSTGVPTLVAGYSVKAKGIARDIFGTFEGYVLPVQSLKEEGELLSGFLWLMKEEEAVKARLREVMPEYKKRALQTGEELKRIYQSVTSTEYVDGK